MGSICRVDHTKGPISVAKLLLVKGWGRIVATLMAPLALILSRTVDHSEVGTLTLTLATPSSTGHDTVEHQYSGHFVGVFQVITEL